MGEVLGFPRIDPVDAQVGARLRRWRTERHMDLDVLAHAVKVTPRDLQRMEAGRQHLTSLQMAAATDALHLPLWALVSDTRAY